MNFPSPTPKQAQLMWLALTGIAIATMVLLVAGLIWGLGQALHILAPVIWPLAIAGVPPEMFGFVLLGVQYYQIWAHTEQIGKLGWLDRVLTTGRYVIPIWYSDISRMAHAKTLHHPEKLPIYGDWLGFQPEVWWYQE